MIDQEALPVNMVVIDEYLRWAGDRQGRDFDASPAAYVTELAMQKLVQEGRDLLTSIEDIEPAIWKPFERALDAYVNFKENL